MRRMKLSDIKISDAFENSIPSEEKLKKCRNNWNQWNRQDRYIVVNPDNVLMQIVKYGTPWLQLYMQNQEIKTNMVDGCTSCPEQDLTGLERNLGSRFGMRRNNKK